MPNGNTTPSESTSPDAISDKIQYYVIKKYDKKEEARLKKIDNDEDLKNEFKQDLRARLQQGKLDDVRFISPSKDEAFQNRATRILRDALFEIDLEMQSEEWNKDPRNVITNEDSANNIAKGADPIELFSGNFVYSNEDISISGAGMDFVFKRTHSHQSVYRGPLGEKWDHNYNLRLIVTNDHNLIYRSNGNGTQTLYRRHNFHNYWLTEKGEDGVITESANGFVWHSSNGVEFFYESQFNSNPDVFLIKIIKDRFENNLQFQYDSGLLIKVFVNNTQRLVTFQYDSTGKIIHIRDFFGRQWNYTYDDFDDLIAVTTPAPEKFGRGFVTRYEYSTASQTDKQLQHNILAIIDAKGQIYLENEYGTNPNLLTYNRIIRQRQGGGESLLDYLDIVEDFTFYYESNQLPTFQTIVTGREGHMIRYLFNRYGNMIFKEEYARINGIPKIISFHYRYNRDGNLVGILSPEGSVTQFLYGRDYYERKIAISQDYIDLDDQKLNSKIRQSFSRLLATVKRGKYHSISSLNLSHGLWGDIFPDIYDTSVDDIIKKFTHEEDYGQLLTISDPRHTESADPDFFESSNYFLHLTHYSYKSNITSNFHLLNKIETPSTTSPAGTDLGPSIVQMSLYDEHGRILETIGPEGLVTLTTYYEHNSGLLEGFLRETELDPGGLSIRTAVDRDELGRIIKNYSPKFFDDEDDKFTGTITYNDLSQIITISTNSSFNFKLHRNYDQVGNIKQESYDRKRFGGVLYDEPLEVKTYDYDEEFQVTKTKFGGIKHPNYKVSHNIYDIAGRLLLSISPAGRISKFYYNERSLLGKKVIDHGGISSTLKMFYDADGRMIRKIDAVGTEEKFFYDPLNRMIESIDVLGNRRFFAYDKLGNVITERFFETRAGHFWLLFRSERTYDELGRLVKSSVNEFESPVEVIGVDVKNAFVQHGPGELRTTLYFYDKNGHMTKKITPRGQETTMEYDKVGRLVMRIDANGNKIKYRYDKHGNLVRYDIEAIVRDSITNGISGQRYFAHTFVYDELNRLVKQTDSLGNNTHYEHNSLDQITKIIDALENITEYEHDVFGRIIQVNRLLKHESNTNPPVIMSNRYTYDLDDYALEQIDQLGRPTKFQYDGMGRLIATILPDSSRDLSDYDRSGKIMTYTDRNGVIQQYQYDKLGRMISLNINDTNILSGLELKGSHTKISSYDALGRIISIENEFCKYSFEYNSLGLLTKEVITYISPDNQNNHAQFIILRKYNMSGALSEIVYPSGRKIQYSRDILDRIISIEQVTKGLSYPGDDSIPENFVIMEVEYEGLQRKIIKRHNQTSTEFHYDGGGRMIEIKHNYKDGLLSHLQYLYDAVGNIRQRTEESSESDRTSIFHYDSLYRLRDVSNMEVNSINNLESLYPADDPISESIPDLQAEINNFIRADIPRSREYTYDATGNRVTIKEGNLSLEDYISNDLDQYSSINSKIMKYDKMGNLIEDEKWIYRYNFNNQLSLIKRKDDNQITNFYHDPLSRKILETRTNQVKLIINDIWNVIEEYDGNNILNSVVSDEGFDNIIEVSTENANFWIYSDIVKSTTHILNGEEKDQHFEYEEFGKIHNSTSSTQDGTITNRFAGKRLIPELEKYEFVLRTYDPSTGRFLQRDPKGYIEGTNLYTYALNNPASRTDPLGTDSRYDRNVYDTYRPMIDYQFWEFGPRSEHIPLPGYTGPLRQRKKYTKPMAMDLAKAGHYEAAELAENYMCPSCHMLTKPGVKENFNLRGYVDNYNEYYDYIGAVLGLAEIEAPFSLTSSLLRAGGNSLKYIGKLIRPTRLVALDTDALMKIGSAEVRGVLQRGDRLVITQNVLTEFRQNALNTKGWFQQLDELGKDQYIMRYLDRNKVTVLGEQIGATVPASRLRWAMDIKIGGEVAGKGNLGDALNISEAGAAGVDLFVTTDKATIGETFGLSGEIPLPLSEGTFVPFRVVDESTIGFWSRFWSYFK